MGAPIQARVHPSPFSILNPKTRSRHLLSYLWIAPTIILLVHVPHILAHSLQLRHLLHTLYIVKLKCSGSRHVNTGSALHLNRAIVGLVASGSKDARPTMTVHG